MEAVALPVWFDVLAMALNGIFGAAVARSRNFPVYGTLLAGVLVGLGGGMVRDVLLGREPVAIAQWFFIPAVLIGALIGAFAYKYVTSTRISVQILHAAVLGFLVTIGAQVALHAGAPIISAILLGVVTASAGGMIVDGMSGRKSAIADPQAHWFASALFIGSVVFVAVSVTLSFWLAVAAAVIVIAVLNVLSNRLQWLSPLWPHERQQLSPDSTPS
jgi:uncharacterized membrane protein YeiH